MGKRCRLIDRTTKYFLIAASCVVIFHGAVLPIYLLLASALEKASVPALNPSSNAQTCLAKAGPMPLPEEGEAKFNQWEKSIQDCYSR